MNSARLISPWTDGAGRSALLAWGIVSILGGVGLLANAPAPRRVFLLLALLAWIAESVRRPKALTPCLAFVPWVGVVLLSVVWSPAPVITLIDAMQEVVSPLAAGLLAASLASRIERRYLYWPFLMLAIAALLAAFGGVHIHGGFWPMAPTWLVAGYPGRGVASTLGVFLTLSSIALLVIHWAGQSFAARWLFGLGTVMLPTGMLLGVLGHNRMFWFSLCLGFLPWLALGWHALPKWRLGMGGGVLALLIAGTVYSSYVAERQGPLEVEKVVTNISASYASDPRWLLWQSWLPVAAERPLFGFGYGSRILPRIGAANVSTGNPELDSAAQHHAHNVLFNTVLQTGLIGLLAFLVALLGVWRLIFSGAPPFSEAAEKWRIAALSLLIAGVAKSLTDDFFWGPAGIVMWLLIGTMAGLGRRSEQS